MQLMGMIQYEHFLNYADMTEMTNAFMTTDSALILEVQLIRLVVNRFRLSQAGVTITDVYAIVNGAIQDLNVPSAVSELDNDSGYITSSYLSSYYDKDEVDGLLSSKADISALSTKQDVIDASNKLAYSLISGTPTIPTKTSDLTNDSNFITNAALADYQEKITNAAKLDYALISGTPTIPTKTSDLTNDSNYATSAYVDDSVSGKLTAPAGGISGQFLMKTNDGTEWATIQGSGAGDSYTKQETDALLSAKQDLITNAAKLDYALLSGTPTIPTNTNALTNGACFTVGKSGGVLSALNIDVVDALPVDPDSSTIYFVRSSNA